jgi:murein DD-endopeptidase MepM/ murein hydrolase activator NlpD
MSTPFRERDHERPARISGRNLRLAPRRMRPWRQRFARAFSIFMVGFLLGAASLFVALARSGGLMPPPVRQPLPSASPESTAHESALAPAPEPAATPPSPVPGDSTDGPANLFAPPLDLSRPSPAPVLSDFSYLQRRWLMFPVVGFDLKVLRDDFAEKRGDRVHEAIDILAPRGTPVAAVDDGTVVKLFNSVRGGLTIYQFDPAGQYCYYYAHLDRYAEGLGEGQLVRKGQWIGYVGTSGNAPPNTPHLHFTIFKLGPEKRWWEGTPVNPFPLWALSR